MTSQIQNLPAADIDWRPAPPGNAGTVADPSGFREAIARIETASVPPAGAAAPANRPEIVPHPFYEGEFVDARTGRLVLPEHPSATAHSGTAETARLVPHPFYEGEYYDPEKERTGLFGEDGLTFDDVLDLLNPLQHIPIVSTLYRELTGDTVDPGIRLIGGAALGGPIGFASALVNAVIEDGSGRDAGGHLLAMLTGEESAGPEFAALDTAAGPPAGAAPAIAWDRPASADGTAMAPAAYGLTDGLRAATPAAATAQDMPTPAAALLQARAAVPAPGPVAALGPERAIRLSAPAAAAPPSLSSRLDAHLQRLAAQSSRQAAAPAVAPPEPAGPETVAPAQASTDPAPSAPPTGPAATPVPTPLVPQAMAEALDKYRAMMRQGPSAARAREDESI